MAFQPRSLFGLRPPYTTPGIGDEVRDLPAPGIGAPMAAAEPFIFGKGGARLTPEQAAAAREGAARQMAEAGDFSPVGHWTQGLARALGGLTGGLEMRRARKAEEANAAESHAVLQALLEGASGADPAANKSAILAALVNPYVDDRTRGLAEMQFKAMQPKQYEPPEIVQLARVANDTTRPQWERDAAAAAVKAKNDPFTVLQLRSGTLAGPVSLVQQAIQQGGGGQTSGAASTAPPPADAVADLRGDPSPTARMEFDEMFGQGAAARALGQGGPAATPGSFPGD